MCQHPSISQPRDADINTLLQIIESAEHVLKVQFFRCHEQMPPVEPVVLHVLILIKILVQQCPDVFEHFFVHLTIVGGSLLYALPGLINFFCFVAASILGVLGRKTEGRIYANIALAIALSFWLFALPCGIAYYICFAVLNLPT